MDHIAFDGLGPRQLGVAEDRQHAAVVEEGVSHEPADAEFPGPLGQTGEQCGPETSPLPRVGDDESHLGLLATVGKTIEPTHANDLVVMDGDHGLSVPMVHVGEPVELLVAQLRMHPKKRYCVVSLESV